MSFVEFLEMFIVSQSIMDSILITGLSIMASSVHRAFSSCKFIGNGRLIFSSSSYNLKHYLKKSIKFTYAIHNRSHHHHSPWCLVNFLFCSCV